MMQRNINPYAIELLTYFFRLHHFKDFSEFGLLSGADNNTLKKSRQNRYSIVNVTK